MKAEVINVISKEIDNGIAKYYVYKFVINNDVDYEDIYDNIDDYEYPYNHVNRSDL